MIAAIPILTLQFKDTNLSDYLLDKGMPLYKKLVKIGRDPLSYIVVVGFLMGQTAATISRRPNGYVLSFVEGMTTPKVNGKTVKGSVILREFDKIEIGSVQMEFIMKD